MPNLSQQVYASRVRLGEIVPEAGGFAISHLLLVELLQGVTDLVAYWTGPARATPTVLYPEAIIRRLAVSLACLARNANHDLEEDLAQWSYALAAQKKPPEPLPVQRAPLPQEIAGGFIR